MTDKEMYVNPKEFIKASDGDIMKMTGAKVTGNEPVGNYGADLTSMITADTKATGKVAPAMPHTEAKK